MKKVSEGFMGFGGSSDPKDCKPIVTGEFKGLIQVYNDERK